MKAKYGDIVDYQCPNCGRNMQYTYETMNGHQLMCMYEIGYLTISEEQYQKLKVLDSFDEKLKRVYGSK